jgi:PiT family inorganic phosphate transporter
MDTNLLAVVALITVALVFDFINGFHDAANSIATVVSTRVLTPGRAVIWAAFFNFVAAFTFGTAVAKTVGSGLVDISIVTFTVIFAGLMGAIIWDLITWYYGLPTSSSHALIGGYAGAAVTKAGWSAIIVSGWTKTLIFIVLAPLIGMSLGFVLMVAILWISGSGVYSFCRPRPTASATAATTRRRRWASSPGRSSPAAISGWRTAICRSRSGSC